ncbi:MAG: hypothetical protein IH840_16970, partial [Candidatus Heimdallarchaeota archaeon]|nr:hypothetical protein [Candidatus Heimdallarchaeota archaeon]
IVQEEMVRVKIVGFYESMLIANDEILTSLPVARTIAGYEKTELTHYRVRFDPMLATKESLLADITTIVELTINIKIGNVLESLSRYRLRILDAQNEVIFWNGVKEQTSMSLFRGNYVIQITLDQHSIISENIQLNQDLRYELNLSDKTFHVSGKLTFQDIVLPHTPYIIRKIARSFTLSDTTSEMGYFEQYLTRGNYSIIFTDDFDNYEFQFNVDGNTSLSFNLQPKNWIGINDFYDGIILTKNEFTIPLANISQSTIVQVDGSQQNIIRPTLTEIPQLKLNLTDGPHTLSLLRGKFDFVYFSVNFIVNSSITPLEVAGLVNYAHYKPNQEFFLIRDGLVEDTIETTQGYLILNTFSSILVLPKDVGFYKLEIIAKDVFGNIQRTSFEFIITQKPEIGGIAHSVPNPLVRSNDTISVWISGLYDQLLFIPSLGSISNFEQGFQYTVPNLSPGFYRDIIASDQLMFNITFTVVETYRSIFNYHNATGVYNFDEPAITSEFEINFPTHEFYQEADWSFQIDFGQGFFSVYTNQIVSIPNSAELIQAKIRINSTVTNTTENYIFNTFDPLNKIDRVTPKNGIPSFIKNGIFDLVNVQDQLLNFRITKDNQPYDPIYLSDNSIQLAPGNYSMVLSSSLVGGSEISKNITVPVWKNKAFLNSDYIGYERGYLIGVNATLFATEFKITNGILINEVPPSPNIVGFRNLITSNYEVSYTGFVAGTFTIIDNTGLTTTGQLNASEFSFDDLETRIINLQLSGSNLRNITTHAEFEFSTGLMEKNFYFEIIEGTIKYSDNITVYLELKETRQEFKFQITEFNSSFQLSFIPQEIGVIITSNGILIFEDHGNSNKTTQIILGAPTVKFLVYHTNFDRILENPSIILISRNNNSISLALKSNQSYVLDSGNYVIEV